MFRTTVLSLSGLSLGSAYTFRVWRGPMGWATPCTLGEGVTFGQLTVTAGELGNCQAITDITAGGSASYIVTNGTNGPTIVLDSTADCSGSAVAFPPTRVVFEAVPWSPVTSDVTGDQAMAGHALGECTLPRGLGALAGVAVQSLSSSWDETDGSPIDLFAAADCAASAGPVTTYLRAPLGTCTPFIQLAAARADACTAAGLTVSVFPGDLECSNAPVLPSLAAVTLPVDGTCMNLFPATGAGPFPAGFSVRVTQPCVTQGEQEGEVGEGPVQQEPSPSSSSSPVASSSVPAASADANGAASLRLSWGLAVMAALVYAAAGH